VADSSASLYTLRVEFNVLMFHVWRVAVRGGGGMTRELSDPVTSVDGVEIWDRSAVPNPVPVAREGSDE